MNTALIVLYCFSLLAIGFCSLMLYRNNLVLKERLKVLDMASEQAKWIIECGIGTYRQPYDYFESVSYDEMLYKFWKPVDSFYDYEKFSIPK